MSAPSIPVVTSQIDWRGVAISISYHRHQWSTFDHIEVNVIGDGIIPITETGYRSHFTSREAVEDHGGTGAFAIAWLNHEAQGEAWQRRVEQSKQLSLF